MDDAELLAQAGGGDAAALSVLYERHHRPVYRFVRRLGGSIEMAKDVMNGGRDTSRFLAPASSVRSGS